MAHNNGMHDCAAEGCTVQVTASKLMCWDHWKSLPRSLQNEVNYAWRYVKRDPEAYREVRERAVAAAGKSTPKQGNLL